MLYVKLKMIQYIVSDTLKYVVLINVLLIGMNGFLFKSKRSAASNWSDIGPNIVIQDFAEPKFVLKNVA